MNFVCYCSNILCDTVLHNGMFIIQPKQGYGIFDIINLKNESFYCPECQQLGSFNTVGFCECQYSFVGIKSSKPNKEKIGSGSVSTKFCKYHFDNSHFIKWDKLVFYCFQNSNSIFLKTRINEI